ncbi:amino acid adenylation domain-containing protein [Ruminococcus sp.]|uniref:amino acid adenylation domain-containing protein n=1 Tax=Ruminococcus sp. TaxID=41978 RepID=UPI002BBF6688|nr:amino acid adenylation domain-containing protein [Ruminococcus sp.]HNZ98847.1 amino acid adenylation domain-containing protein [Ruminococcus sp.]HOH86258.1 amino acid adenylation domain-containing protein [Ruminococcus sp.]
MLSEIRIKVNQTEKDIVEKLIHEDFFRIAAESPERCAVVQRDEKGGYERFTYGQIADRALRYCRALTEKGAAEGSIIAAALEKSAEYISAVMGILAAGCAFLPMSSTVPDERRKYICEKAQVRFVITDAENCAFFEDLGMDTVTPEAAEGAAAAEGIKHISADSDAYIIFTSGTTGQPKGVEIQHFAAHNTIADINERFGVTENDSAFAVSEIDFDLSVYDIFGLLSAGGKVVISDKGMKKEAGLWTEVAAHEGVTVWNSVPMLLEMLLCADADNRAVSGLRLIMVSGDWVYPSLVEKVRGMNSSAEMIALGGATEASIWSNYFNAGRDTDSSWSSVPYGVPLHNQKYRIVDKDMKDCADNEPGEILIGGKGLARGYVNMPELTAERFITDGGERWYRTGDKGMYWSDGNIEFLGRLDDQVKFGGYRVELGEITRKLISFENIRNAHTIMVQKNTKQFLASVIVEADDGSRCVPQMTGDADDHRDEIVASQNDVVEAFLIRILELEKHLPISSGELFEKLGFTEDYRGLFSYWINTLVSLGVVSEEGGRLAAGSGFGKDLSKTERDMMNEMMSRIGFIGDILRGKRNSADMFSDEVLSPEKMSMNENGVAASIGMIAQKINDQYDEDGMNIRVAVLGARTGVLAKALLDKIRDADADLTLIDSSDFFIQQARNYMADEDCSFEIVRDYVPEELRNSFDVVIAVNELHTRPDEAHGVFLIRDLMKKNGKAFVADLKELPPLSRITAAVIENAFDHFTAENRPKAQDPTIPAERMAELFAQAGFRRVEWSNIESSLFFFLEAEGKNITEALSVNAVRYYLGQQMPEYMVPEKIIFLDRIPLTKNGKPDRVRIEELVSEEEATELIPPRTETEKKIADLWKQILCVKEVGINQSFFKAGGDSLLATHLLTIVKKEYDIELSLKEMYNDPTLESIAASIDERLAENGDDDTEFGEI